MKSGKRQERDDEVVSARRRIEEHQSGEMTAIKLPTGASMIQIKKKETRRFDIIPYRLSKRSADFTHNFADPGKLYFERTFFIHRGIGPNNSYYTCPARTYGKPCPICEERARAAKDPDGEEAVKALKVSERQLWNVIDLDDKEKGIQILEFPYWNFGKLLDEKIENADDEDKEVYEQFADPKKGLSLRIGVTKEEGGGVYLFQNG